MGEGGHIGGEGGGEGFLGAAGVVEVHALGVEGLAAERQGGLEAGGPAVFGEFEEERFVGAVELVTGDGVAEVGGVGADLVFATGEGADLGEGVAAAACEGVEARGGGAGAAHVLPACLFGGDGAEDIGADGCVHEAFAGEFAGEDGEVGLGDAALFERGLQAARGAGVPGEDDEAAGFAVEPADEVEFLEFEVLAAGTGEAGPRTALGRVADEPAGLVNDDEVIVVPEHP